MKTYNCDICNSRGNCYFSYNSTYGYCDKPKCKEQADNKLYSDIHENISTGHFDLAFELCGDEDPTLYI